MLGVGSQPSTRALVGIFPIPRMQQDGARLSKLKEVFKRATQEILKEEETVKSLMTSPGFKDSFYSESTVQVSPEDVREMFLEIKSRFTEVFKAKIRQTNLDFKLNNLDKDIKDGRVSYKDLKSVDYIKEIFESNIVDKKEEFVKLLEREIEEPEIKIGEMKSCIAGLEKRLKDLERENEELEKEYQSLICEIESVFQEQ